MQLLNITSAEYLPQIVLIFACIFVFIGVFLGLTKRVTFYNDYNDLGLSLATIGIPLCMALVFSHLNLLTNFTILLILILFIILLVILFFNTWKANNKRFLISLIVGSSKLLLSFLFVFYLAELAMGKNRQKRGRGFFILVFSTPLLNALVSKKEGIFRLTTTGRPTFRNTTIKNKDSQYKCPHCNIIAKSENGLNRHIIAKHQGM